MSAQSLEVKDSSETKRTVEIPTEKQKPVDADALVDATVETASWKRDLLKGLFYALLILTSILFFSETASKFIYVDF